MTRNSAIFTAGLLLLAASGNAASAKTWKEAAKAVERLTPPLMKELHVPGVSVALVSSGKVVWSKQYGVAWTSAAKTVDGNTRFEACSMSKPVFAYLAMKLVADKKLDLDRPLSEYFKDPYVPDTPEGRSITARMALIHTTGFPNWRDGDDWETRPLTLSFKPGTKYEYSGEGFYYLQRAVENILGERLEVFSQRMLFKPLGLTHSSFIWTPELDADLASGHDENGVFVKKTQYLRANSAYSLYTTAEDYALFLLEMIRNGQALMTRELDLGEKGWVERPGKAMGLAVYRGFGWAIDATEQGDLIYHSGSNESGFKCYSQFDPKKGTGIVVMTNGKSPFWPRLIKEIGDF